MRIERIVGEPTRIEVKRTAISAPDSLEFSRVALTILKPGASRNVHRNYGAARSELNRMGETVIPGKTKRGEERSEVNAVSPVAGCIPSEFLIMKLNSFVRSSFELIEGEEEETRGET